MTLTEPSSAAVPCRTRTTIVASFAIRLCADRSEGKHDARCVSDMRRLVRARLTWCGLAGLVDDAQLIVSELLTNSIVHSGSSSVSLALQVKGGLLHIQVADGVRREPALRERPGEDAENGRGLELVDATVRARRGAWGVSPDGTFTWCTLRVEGDGP